MGDRDRSVGGLHLATVVVNVQDMQRAVRFWTAALGYQRREKEWDPQFQVLVDARGAPELRDRRDRAVRRAHRAGCRGLTSQRCGADTGTLRLP